jgi:hypothetical protein
MFLHDEVVLSFWRCELSWRAEGRHVIVICFALGVVQVYNRPKNRCYKAGIYKRGARGRVKS